MTKEEQDTAEMDCLRCYNQGYEIGKKDVITKACEWLHSNCYIDDKYLDMFKQAMEHDDKG